MNKVFVLNNIEKYYLNYSRYISDIDLHILTTNELKKYKDNIKLKEEHPLYNDYLRLYIEYIEGGLVIDGMLEIRSSLNNFFKNEVFLGFDTENTIATNIIWCKSKKNLIIKKVLDEIEKTEDKDITAVFSKVLNRDLANTFNSLVAINKEIYIYPYDYFYPIDYERHGKNISENTKTILHKDEKISLYCKIKQKIYYKYGSYSLRYLLSLTDSIRNKIGAKRYINKQQKGKFQDKQVIKSSVQEAYNILCSYKEKNVDYVIFHNPRWMGVTSATKELFENLVPLQGLITDKQVDLIANKIIDIKPKQVIFSAFEYGYDKLARKIRNLDNDIKIKIFWHSSNSQINGQLVDIMNWKTNLKVINLCREGIIDVFGTCKESLVNFYNSQGFNTAFIKNTVRLDENFKNNIAKEKRNDDKILIGIYAAGMDWRKNMFNQIAGASLVNNAVIDSVPLNFDGQVFASKVNTNMQGLKKGVKREELLKRMAQNDINLYVTFSECAPMLPIESMEVGTICLTGDNHHYFKNTELEKYLVVSREDDVCSIRDKIEYALENKDIIFDLYKKWKNSYDNESKESVKSFLNM